MCVNSAKTYRVPESPRYYISVGEYYKAFSVLSYLRWCSCTKDKQKLIDEDKEDLKSLLATQSGTETQAKSAEKGNKDGAGITSSIRRKLSTVFYRIFLCQLWRVPRLSYTRCR